MEINTPVVPVVPKGQLEQPIKIVLPNAFTFQQLHFLNDLKTTYYKHPAPTGRNIIAVGVAHRKSQVHNLSPNGAQ